MKKYLFLFPIFIMLLTKPVSAQIKPLYIEEKISIDGRLNEKSWSMATPLTDFTQRELTEGAPPTEKTEIKFLFDKNNLYIAAICYDSEPDKIVHKELEWDGDIFGDDNVIFVIDTYNDKRFGYYFAVNPNGARFDGTFKSGEIYSSDWDGVWDVSARLTETGWVCEIVIPFKTLRFPDTGVQEWCFNIEREIRRKNEEDMWKGWRRDDGIRQLAKAGTMVFEKPVAKGRQIDVKPYLLAGAEKEQSKDVNDVYRYGLDVRYGITSNMTLDLTTKTDFAQVESDDEQINLTRYSLFYPEKREFFLEGADMFDFTQGGTRLFYSRQIGISPEREEIPILGGAKLIQKAGSCRIGFMTMQTEDEHGYPSTNYSVFRIKKDILEQSYVGFIGTSKYDSDKHDNQVYGMDFGYKTDKFMKNKNFQITGYLSGSVTDGNSDDNLAGRVYVGYPNDTVNLYTLYHVIDSGFNPEVGYVRRTGIRNFIFYMDYTPRVSLPHIKKLFFKPFDMNYYTDMDNMILSRVVQIDPIGFIFNNDDQLEFSIKNEYDYNDIDNWKIFKNVAIPKGSYDWWYYEVEYNVFRTRTFSPHIYASLGDFYTGTKKTGTFETNLKTGSHYGINGSISYSDIDLEGKHITAREYGGKLKLDINTRLYSSTYIQWNNDTDEVITNFRIHYIPAIGSDLYIVYNHILNRGDDYSTLYNTCLLKVNYLYMF